MEESYISDSEFYHPEHPLVLRAADELIGVLATTGHYYDAERFARVCYDSLTHTPLDPDSFEAGKAAANLSRASCDLIKANGPEAADIEEAETLAKKAIRIPK
jgi:hypothetical protein